MSDDVYMMDQHLRVSEAYEEALRELMFPSDATREKWAAESAARQVRWDENTAAGLVGISDHDCCDCYSSEWNKPTEPTESTVG